MSIITRLTDEIRECMLEYNQKPHLILLGKKESDDLFVEMRMKVIDRFRGVKIRYTKELSELRILRY